MSDRQREQQAQAHIKSALREYMGALDYRLGQESDPAVVRIIKDRMIDLDYWYGVWVGDEEQHITPKSRGGL